MPTLSTFRPCSEKCRVGGGGSCAKRPRSVNCRKDSKKENCLDLQKSTCMFRRPCGKSLSKCALSFTRKQCPPNLCRNICPITCLKQEEEKKWNEKKLVGALSAEKMLVYNPLLQWYLNHGVVVTRVYRTINYKRGKPFQWFVHDVTQARRMGDSDESKALLADIFKLLGNSAYGKTIEDVTLQTNVIYTKDENKVDRALRRAFFEDLEEMGPTYRLESRKPRVVIKRPFQVGIAVYQLAK